MMASPLTTGAVVLRLLADAPAFASDVSAELNIPEDTASSNLRRLHGKGLIARRAFWISVKQTRWLYMLPEHQYQPQVKG
jgi:predicted transcriptional regulator